MGDQKDFAKRIDELLELSEEQHHVISKEQLDELFPEVVEDESKKNILETYLREKKIGIEEAVDFEDYITKEEKNYLEFYLEDLKEEKSITKGEKEAYTISAMAGEKSACDSLIRAYLMDVVEIAKLYAGQGVALEDLIGEGNIALISGVSMIGCIEKPEEADGFLGKFIMDAMEEIINETNDDKNAQEKMLDKVNRISQKAGELAGILGRKVTVQELADEYKISRAQINMALSLTANHIEDIEPETNSGNNNMK